MSKSGPKPSIPSPLQVSVPHPVSPLSQFQPAAWEARAYLSILEDVQNPRGVVSGPYLSHSALLIDVEVAFLPKDDLGTPAPAVTHH